MNKIIYNTFYKILSNQLRIKLLKKNIYSKYFLKKIIVTVGFKNIPTFIDTFVVESLFALKLITNKKALLYKFTKKYKEYDLHFKLDLKEYNYVYFFMNLIIFSIPLLKRRSIFFNKIFNAGSDFVYSNNNITIYPFFPNTYFAWDKVFNFVFIFKNKNKIQNTLLLNYFNFPIKKK